MNEKQPLHPGVLLKKEIEERQLKKGEFAKSIGYESTHISAVMGGRFRVSIAMAVALEAELGISALHWLTMQAKYDIWYYKKYGK